MLLPPNSKQLFSDVTIIEIDIEIVIFRKIERNQYRDFFGASATRFWYCIALEGPAIGAGNHRMNFTPQRVRSRRCGGIYISANLITPSAEEFMSTTPNIGVKNRIEIKFFVQNLIEIE